MIYTLHLGLSYLCNMRCKHCFVDKSNDKIETTKCKKIIDDLYDNGLMVVIYTFGEPLLAKNFDEMSEYISKKGISQVLMTNGFFLNKKNIDILLKNNVRSVYVSLDNIDPIEHDINRNCPGAFKKAMDGIDLLVSNKINVGLAITITDKNINQMEDFLNLARKKNVKNISFLRERFNGKIKDYDISYYISFFKKYINYDDLNIEYHDPTLLPTVKELYDKGEIELDKYNKYTSMNSCYMNHNLCIAPNGDVTRCNISKKVVGNILNNEILDIIKRSKKNENFICCTKFSKEN